MNLQKKWVQILMQNKRAQDKKVYWITNMQLEEEFEDFFSLNAEDKVRFYKNYKSALHRSDEDGMVPIYDRIDNSEEPIAFMDASGVKYDIFFDEKTMELVPKGAKAIWELVGAPGSGKTTTMLAAPRNLELILKYHDGSYLECTYPYGTAERSRIIEKIKQFQKGTLSKQDQIDSELQKYPLSVVCGDRSASFLLTAESGESFLKYGIRNKVCEQKQDGIIFLVPGGDCKEMMQGDTETETMRLFNQLHYGIRMGEFDKQNLIVIFNQIDKLKHVKNEHIQNILSKNTIGRDEEGNLILHNKGMLDMDELQWMQQEMLHFLKETNPLFYGKLKQIACYCNVTIFVNAELNQEIEGLKYNPEEITPFRTDEFWLYFLHMNGMAKSSKKANKYSNFMEWMKGDH